MAERPHPHDPSVAAVALAAAPLLTRGVELIELLGALVDAVVEQLRAEKGTLYLVDAKNERITSVVTDVAGGITLAIGQGLAGTVAKDSVVVNVSDAAADPRFHPVVDKKTGFHTRSVLAVPVTDTAGDTIGVLQLLNAKDGSFSVDDQAQALLLARQAGSVLERTSLYADLKRRAPIASERSSGLSFRFNQIVGESPPMRAAYAIVEKAARTDANVLISGETGTGKELFARAIHMNSRRRGQPFIKVDCTTLPEALMENELFGHEKGAFTGADRAVPGKFEAAHGGTLFIDEIGELPLKLQGKLLRVLQDREFERVGGTRTVTVDVRIVCATHRDLAAMVDVGAFREDLFYRIRVVPLTTPALRDRGSEDLLRLMEHFVVSFGRRHGRPGIRLADAALARLKAYAFPGNIRELEHIIESAVVLCDGDVIEARDLAIADRKKPTTLPSMPALGGLLIVGDPTLPLERVEREHIRLVVDACGGNQSEAARKLGISRNTLARKLAGEPPLE